MTAFDTLAKYDNKLASVVELSSKVNQRNQCQ